MPNPVWSHVLALNLYSEESSVATKLQPRLQISACKANTSPIEL